MNEEYLWDKSGEPDPEIAQLEEILGTLKYKPRPLDLSDQVKPASRNRYLPLLAIAAALVIALVVGLIWLRTTSTKDDHQQITHVERPTVPSNPPSSEVARQDNEQKAAGPVNETKSSVVARNTRRLRSPKVIAPSKEALEAKEQLMTALRLASEKLSLAQKKTQGPATPNQIRNQHKIG